MFCKFINDLFHLDLLALLQIFYFSFICVYLLFTPLSSKVFISWLTWAHERRIERTHAHQADVLLREKSRILVLRHSLNHWYRSVAINHKLALATRHAFLYTIRSSFQHWRTWCDVRRKQLQMKIAADRFRTVTLEVSFSRYLKWPVSQKAIKML